MYNNMPWYYPPPPTNSVDDLGRYLKAMKKMKKELEEERRHNRQQDTAERKKRGFSVLEVTVFLLLIAPFVGSAYALLIIKMMQTTAGMLR
jgi:hypothetical protein